MSSFIKEVLKQMNTQLNRIEICLKKLSEEDVWKKVKSNTNSIGNLCVHLAGNEYQHFVSGIGEKPFIRERSLEFSDTHSLKREELINRLRFVRQESTAILLRLNDQDLKNEVKVYYDEEDWKRMRKVLEAGEPFYIRPIQTHLFLVAEHYGYHTGQIVYITKLLQEDEDHITETRH
ncbi:MAG: hypothetical protein JWM44_4433 [Bacilli bacterium]|nr:hypothetical protein [Bacilli bacterium]